MSRKLMYEKWNKRTSSGQNPNVSSDSFGVAMRDSNRQTSQLYAKQRAQRAKMQRDAIAAAARKKSWLAAQKNRKRFSEFLNI